MNRIKKFGRNHGHFNKTYGQFYNFSDPNIKGQQFLDFFDKKLLLSDIVSAEI